MSTQPGDLVLDPTCGSGTTAYVAENWGRRWITIDTSRVAVAIARQRLLTRKFDYYEVKDEAQGVRGGLKHETVPHITLKSIARNTNLDPIFEKHEPILDERLAQCNEALKAVTDGHRAILVSKMLNKQKEDGKRSITDADKRRWELPKPEERWEHWQVPFDADKDYPQALKDAVTAYRRAWREKMDEVNACIDANAEQEPLVDKPVRVKNVVRVTGPFTVEAVQPPEVSLTESVEPAPEEGLFDGEPPELEDTFVKLTAAESFHELQNVGAYLDAMFSKLKMDGVRFPDNKQMQFTRLEKLQSGAAGLHAEGRWTLKGTEDEDAEGSATVAVAFGPQYGAVTTKMVQEVIRSAYRMGYDDLVIAGFSFDGSAQTDIDEAQHPNLRIHAAHIRPDANPGMDGLLKEQPGSQLFTVFGQPRSRLEGPDRHGEYRAIMEGVDIYDPVQNVVLPTVADKVAAWFIDGDYDGRTFCITQAFFPDKSAWKKLKTALKDLMDEDAFEALSGTESLPFPLGEN